MDEPLESQSHLTSNMLTKNGSPIIGKSSADITIVDNVTRAMKLLIVESKKKGRKSFTYNNKKNLKVTILEIKKNLERRAKNA